MKKPALIFFCIAGIFCLCLLAGCVSMEETKADETVTITDALGREVVIPKNPERIAVSGSGSTRLIAYLDALDNVVAVDYQDSSTTESSDLRPYGLANPSLRTLPILGTGKAVIDAERLLAVEPDLILIGSNTKGTSEADAITEKTGVPAVAFIQYDPGTHPDKFAENLRLLGTVLGKEQRAEDLLTYFEEIKADLKSRVPDIPDEDKPMVYVGGVAYSGSHGLYSTQPNYLPFRYLDAKNVAAGADLSAGGTTENAKIAKEQILAWDPDILFVDLATLSAAGGGSIVELTTDPSYNRLKAVETGEVYTVLPHTSMGANYETILADAYYVGTVLYPEEFADIDPAVKAGEIYEFVVGKNIYDQLNANVDNLAFKKLEITVTDQP